MALRIFVLQRADTILLHGKLQCLHLQTATTCHAATNYRLQRNISTSFSSMRRVFVACFIDSPPIGKATCSKMERKYTHAERQSEYSGAND